MSTDRPVIEQAFEEMLLEFTENCPPPLTNRSRELLETLFEATIHVLLEDREIEWDGRAKRFCLGAAAGLGREVHTKAGNGPVTEPHVVAGLKILIPYWERICPLPVAGQIEPLGEDCTILRGMLDMPPAASTKTRNKSAKKKKQA